MSRLPRYPIYVPSKSRHLTPLTARFLRRDGVPFHLVVEPQEADAYAAAGYGDCLLLLPFGNLNQGSIPARNWIKAHATAAGHARHWQLDDNIHDVRRLYGGKRIPCNAGPALALTEDFADRYENVAVAGLNYYFFVQERGEQPPFYLNVHVYSCSLILNGTPHRWRMRYNDDTDYCLQVLADGWCTVLINAFMARKTRTLTMPGGNTDQLYQGDGRLRMARTLERRWPGVVKVKRRFGRPQHIVDKAWRHFDTPLIRRKDIDWDALTGTVDEYGLTLTQVADTVKSPTLRALLKPPVLPVPTPTDTSTTRAPAGKGRTPRRGSR